LHDVLQRVLCCKTVHDVVITIDHSRMLAWIVAALHQAATLHMVSSPQPEVVTDHVAGVQLQHRVCLRSRGRCWTTNTHEHIMHESRILRISRHVLV
jgi:hypothetical protein